MDRRPVEQTDRHTVVNTDGPTKENGTDALYKKQADVETADIPCKTRADVETADRHTM